MKIETNSKPRTPNPANPLRKEANKKKQLVYYVDLDGTLAMYNCWGNVDDIGEPIPIMRRWVLYWISQGIKIKIFTARAYKPTAILFVKNWLLLNGFPLDLEITNIKGLDCDMIFDNNCRQVMNNQGNIINLTGEFNIEKLKEKKNEN